MIKETIKSFDQSQFNFLESNKADTACRDLHVDVTSLFQIDVADSNNLFNKTFVNHFLLENSLNQIL